MFPCVLCKATITCTGRDGMEDLWCPGCGAHYEYSEGPAVSEIPVGMQEAVQEFIARRSTKPMVMPQVQVFQEFDPLNPVKGWPEPLVDFVEEARKRYGDKPERTMSDVKSTFEIPITWGTRVPNTTLALGEIRYGRCRISDGKPYATWYLRGSNMGPILGDVMPISLDQNEWLAKPQAGEQLLEVFKSQHAAALALLLIYIRQGMYPVGTRVLGRPLPGIKEQFRKGVIEQADHVEYLMVVRWDDGEYAYKFACERNLRKDD
jgi:hypothetical protein